MVSTKKSFTLLHNSSVVTDDLYDNGLAITDTGVVSEEDTNSNLNAVDVDVEYQKEVRNNPIIVTNSRNQENNSSPRIWNASIVVQHSDNDGKNMDPKFYENDSSID